MNSNVCVYIGDKLASYNFGPSHPFGPMRHDAFVNELKFRKLEQQVRLLPPLAGTDEQILLFHTPEYLEQVKLQSKSGSGFLDHGDTPAFKGVYEAASWVVGTVVDAVDQIMGNHFHAAFIPIAGLHHARRAQAAGFCVFNDCGVAIEHLRKKYGLQSIAYVDIDAHHGDGVYYAFENDADVLFADLHEDGKFLYPGSGGDWENGKQAGANRKLNIPMPPQASDEMLQRKWLEVEAFLNKFTPEFVILQAGADSLSGDPITHLEYTANAHAHVTARLCELSLQWKQQRILVLGGGGYNLKNIAQAWTAVVEQLISKIVE